MVQSWTPHNNFLLVFLQEPFSVGHYYMQIETHISFVRCAYIYATCPVKS